MTNKDIDNDLLLPEIRFGRHRAGHPSREDDYDYDNDINRIFPTAEYIESLSPEKHRRDKLAAEVLAICCSLAGPFLESQDESILDDYDW